jgi:Spy/CpxP family protein refolding chaperone
MKRYSMSTLWLCLFLCAGASKGAYGQGPGGHPPSGPPGGRVSSGAPGAPGNSNVPGNSNGPGNASRQASVTTANGVKLGPPGRWWDDRATTQAVGLRKDQQKKMDVIFDASKPAIISAYVAFQKQQTALNELSKSPQVDKAKIFAAIDSVNQARAALEKANTQMLLQIQAQLDPAQLAKLESLP